MFLSSLHNQKLVIGTVTVTISQPGSKSSNISAFFPSPSHSRYKVREFYLLAPQIPVRTHTHTKYVYDLSKGKIIPVSNY